MRTTRDVPQSFTPVAIDLSCQACHGHGEIALRKAPHCIHTDPRCPCGWVFGTCQRCDGSGVEWCQACGDEPATEVDDAGLLCRACLDDRCYTEDTHGWPHDAWSGPIAENH